MYKVAQETLDWAHKPFDIVSDGEGSVGFVQEVSVNSCQESKESQISYAVNWFYGSNGKFAWFGHEELTVHGNLFVKIAESTCSPHGRNDRWVSKLMKMEHDNA